MYKTTRNLTVLGIGLGVSAVVGWLLLRENKRQDADASITVKSQRHPNGSSDMPGIVLPLEALEDSEASDSASEQADDLTRITGIGPRFAEALAAIGIVQFSQLAEQNPSTLAERLAPHVTVSEQRIRDKDWIGQAATLAQQ